MPQDPDDIDPRPVRVERVMRRVTYAPGKREERKLHGKIAAIGSRLEHSDAGIIQVPDQPNYLRALCAFYHRFPDHPNHPQWRPELDARLHERMSVEARVEYFRVVFDATMAWCAAHPKALPVHPASGHWNPMWDSLQDDPDQLWVARNALLMANESKLRAVPGLWELLREQLGQFMAEHYEPRRG